MEFSIYRLDYISSVYIHTHVGLVSAVPGALVTTRPCEDRAYDCVVLEWVVAYFPSSGLREAGGAKKW